MHALVKGAAAAAVLSALGALGAAPKASSPASAGQADDGPRGVVAMPCDERTVPDGTSCVPIPRADEPIRQGGPAALPSRGTHASRGVGMTSYDHLPRRPDRPASADEFVYPVGSADQPPAVLSGYDLGRPGLAQRVSGDEAHQVGHGAVDLAAARGAPVHLVHLTGQEGPASVLFVGRLFGLTVVTSHSVRESGRLRQYLLFHGHLDRPAPGLVPTSAPSEGDVLGFVGDTGSPGNVHLHLEVRRVRADVDIGVLEKTVGSALAPKLVSQAVSIPCDPRNVLPLR